MLAEHQTVHDLLDKDIHENSSCYALLCCRRRDGAPARYAINRMGKVRLLVSGLPNAPMVRALYDWLGYKKRHRKGMRGAVFKGKS